jgi:orotate phosphoribosyltransferase
VEEEVDRLLSRREGHFVLESGHHGDLWLDLELLFLRPERVQPLAAALADRLAKLDVEGVCGPLVEGAFVGLLVSAELRVSFSYSEPVVDSGGAGLFPVSYRIPAALRPEVHGKRIAVVNDVINAGSAVRGTLTDLRERDAKPVAIGTLAVLGHAAHELASAQGVSLETLAALPNRIWEPAACPLCKRGVPLLARPGGREVRPVKTSGDPEEGV